MIKYLSLGFFVKAITGLDDTITHIPVIASITHTRKGKIAFLSGAFIAILAAIVVAIFFSAFLKIFPYYRYIAAALIFILAAAIYLDLFVHEPRSKAEKKIIGCGTLERCLKLFGIGFIASFATAIDGIIAYSSLFLENSGIMIYSIIGIIIASFMEMILILYFSEKISKFRYKEELASLGLIILGILLLLGIV